MSSDGTKFGLTAEEWHEHYIARGAQIEQLTKRVEELELVLEAAARTLRNAIDCLDREEV